jgi:hypothetical protein
VAAAFGAALRVRRLTRTEPIDQIVARLRDRRSFSGALRDPLVHQRVVERLLPVLPPADLGPCLKRSLILLHLWSRCGVDARLHLGCVVPPATTLQAHAWLTTREWPVEGPVTSSLDHQELFVF